MGRSRLFQGKRGFQLKRYALLHKVFKILFVTKETPSKLTRSCLPRFKTYGVDESLKFEAPVPYFVASFGMCRKQ